jgi:hypothetical protein
MDIARDPRPFSFNELLPLEPFDSPPGSSPLEKPNASAYTQNAQNASPALRPPRLPDKWRDT